MLAVFSDYQINILREVFKRSQRNTLLKKMADRHRNRQL